MILERFNVDIRDSRIRFKSDHHKSLFLKFVAQFEGKSVWLSLTEKKNRRSAQQHAYYWLYLTIIAEHTGHDKDDLHEYFKGKYLSTGIVEIFGQKVRKKRSTTNLTVGQFCEYLMKIEQETEIPLPDTTLHFGFSYHK